MTRRHTPGGTAMVEAAPRYCVIGAGAAGLAALQTLLGAGRTVDCFEASDRVGGHWNTDYEALHLITSRDVTGYAGFPMPADYPLFPSRDQVTAYLNAYADAHDLRPRITFGVRVESVEPVPLLNGGPGSTGSAGWVVRTSDGAQRAYDGVFVANGHLHDQRVPQVPGEFTGTQVHSGSYSSTADVEGRRVLVVGSGNSGCDLAVDAAQHRLEVSICIRSGHYFQPKTFFGVPRSELGWLKQFTFEEQDLLTRLLITASKGTYENYPGLPEPPFRTLAEGAPIVNELLLYWIQHGRVTVVPGIERFEGRTVHFADGSAGEFDTILWATGFHPSLPFLADDLLQTDGGVPLRTAGGVVPAGLDRLYLIGLAAPRGPQIALYPVQSQLALSMAELWEDGLDRSLAAALEAEQPLERRIDMVRPDWETQMEASRDLVQRLAAELGARLTTEPPHPPHEPVPEEGSYDEAAAVG
ncbi:flavin-containing monooxygenase [Microlunatus sagamiharensis]|nr:NAD(P)/FAD-dependent oxidoreductase [Microlunatus sagamiharensis]